MKKRAFILGCGMIFFSPIIIDGLCRYCYYDVVMEITTIIGFMISGTLFYFDSYNNMKKGTWLLTAGILLFSPIFANAFVDYYNYNFIIEISIIIACMICGVLYYFDCYFRNWRKRMCLNYEKTEKYSGNFINLQFNITYSCNIYQLMIVHQLIYIAMKRTIN